MAKVKREKSRDIEAHARKRLRTRCGLEGSRSDIDSAMRSIIGLIQSGDARCLEKQSHRLSIFEVSYSGMKLYPVYDRQRRLVVTFLTHEMLVNRDVTL